MTTKYLVSGTSSSGSLDDALKDAIDKMLALAGQHGADLVVKGQLSAINTSAGGLGGTREVVVDIVAEIDV